jgi:hypothetical protein
MSFFIFRTHKFIDDLSTLDAPQNIVLDNILAKATTLDAQHIKCMRILPENANWHRPKATWCPRCIQGDRIRYSEVYERAIWRLGFYAVCPIHGVLLRSECRNCGRKGVCSYHQRNGLLELSCDNCLRPVEAWPAEWGQQYDETDVLGIRITPKLICKVKRLQSDLHHALDKRNDGYIWNYPYPEIDLVEIARKISFSRISAGLLQTEEFDRSLSGQLFSSNHRSITMTLVAPHVAFEMMAVMVASLEALRPEMQNPSQK